MRSKIATFIMSLIIILIIGVLIIFGMLLYTEITQYDLSKGVENFVSTVTSIAREEENLSTPEYIERDLNELSAETVTNSSKVEVGNVTINKYYYNQLEDSAKIFYEAFEKNKENMKTGTYQIELGDIFNDVLSQANGDKLLGEYYQTAVETYIYDNPEVFYLDVNKMYLNIEKITRGSRVTYNVFINNGDQANYLEDGYNEQIIKARLAEIENVVAQIKTLAVGNTYEKIETVHDYIVENTSYDTTISMPDIYNVYGTLVRKSSVCEGYAKTFKLLMDELNIPCVIVIGTATNSSGETENHAWNYVQIGNSWYAVDSTWDDPVVVGGGEARPASKYKYFLKGSTTMSKDHTPKMQFTENGRSYTYPSLNIEDYNI